MVPSISIAFMFVSAIVSIGLPIFLFFIWRKRFALKAVPLLAGIIVYIVFAMILEQILHAIVLRPDANGIVELMQNPVLYVIYGILAAGIFEESGRFIAFQFLKKRYSGVGTGLSYGIGHGGTESVLIVGLAMINNLILSFMINSGVDFGTSQIGASVYALETIEPAMFLVGALERVFALAVQISLSVIVWYAATTKGKWWLFPAAILLHAAFDIPAACAQAGIMTDIVLIEVLTAVATVIIVLLAILTHRKLKVVSDPVAAANT